MDNILSKLTGLFDDFIQKAPLYGFKNNSGKRTCMKNIKIDANHDNTISGVIKMEDFLYFVLRQIFDNYSYEKMNSVMKCEKLTNVTADAYTKQRIRKSYTIFRDLFNNLNKFYNDNRKNMISNSCTVSDCCELQNDIQEVNNLDNINNLDIKTVETIERISKFLAPVDGSIITTRKIKTNEKDLHKCGINEQLRIQKKHTDNNDDGKSPHDDQVIKAQKNDSGNIKEISRVTVSTVFNSESNIPYNVVLDINNSELNSFYAQLDISDKYLVYIFDRKYYSFKVLQMITNKNRGAIFRLSSTSNFYKKFVRAKSNDKLIYLLENKEVDSRTKGAIRVRLIKYFINDQLYVLCTTLRNKKKYSFEILKELYYKRWNVEKYYKILNSDLSFKKTNAKNINTLLQELYGKLSIITLSKIIQEMCLIDDKPNKKLGHINFNNCMNITMTYFSKILIYERTNGTEMKRLIDVINESKIKEKNTINMSHPRRAIRTVFKWYNLGPKNEYHKEQEKIKFDKKYENIDLRHIPIDFV